MFEPPAPAHHLSSHGLRPSTAGDATARPELSTCPGSAAAGPRLPGLERPRWNIDPEAQRCRSTSRGRRSSLDGQLRPEVQLCRGLLGGR